MKRTRYIESQTFQILKEAESRVAVSLVGIHEKHKEIFSIWYCNYLYIKYNENRSHYHKYIAYDYK